MPFTPAHVAAVLPFGRTGLPLSALVAGSTVPDIPMFVPGRPSYGITHTLWGAVTVDVVLATVCVAVWFAVVRDAYADVTPGVRERVPASARLTGRARLLVPVAAALGALTHVVWDSATHDGRWIVERVAWLGDEHAGMLGAQWAQLVSGVVGLLVVAAYTGWWFARRPVRTRSARVARPLAWFVLAPLVAVVAGLVALCGGAGLHDAAVDAAVAGIQGLLVAMLAVSVAWRWTTAPRVEEHPVLPSGGTMRITAERGDITESAVDAIVNAANSSLLGGGGVDGAIHAAAGPRLLEACRELRRTTLPDGLGVGHAVVTPGFDLPAAWVIHTVGPNRHEGQTDPDLLASCFTASLGMAADAKSRTVAFPAVSAGVYGWEADDVARIAVDAVRTWDDENPGAIDEVRFVLFNAEVRAAFERALDD